MALTIKEHIEKGHYERDSTGRALVPMSGGETATIITTNAPDGWCIWGWRSGAWPKRPIAWSADGRPDVNWQPCDWTLLPPPPRKVKVLGWAVLCSSNLPRAIYATESEARAFALDARLSK